MKRFAPLLGLLGLGLLLSQCSSKSEQDQVAGIIDTVFVRDTISVIEKQAFAVASKMNVLYIGVDNPVHLELAGVDANDLRVDISGAGGSIKRAGAANYMATVTQPGEARIRITGGGLRKEFGYRVKRIPDPVARLSNTSGGNIGNGTFKAQGGLGAYLDNFDFDCRCEIQGFQLTKIPKRADPIEVLNLGPRFSDKSRMLIQSAKPGDVYLFTDVKAKCPGDPAGRLINSLAFIIR